MTTGWRKTSSDGHRAGRARPSATWSGREARGRSGPSAPTRLSPRPSSGCSQAGSRSFRCCTAGRAVGSIQEVTIARLLHDGTRSRGESASATSWPVRCRSSTCEFISTRRIDLLMSGNSGVLATEEGAVVDIITRIDLIAYWKGARAG